MSRDLAKTPLFHITDVKNLNGVMADGGLLSDEALLAKGGPAVTIGYANIKRRRMTETRVPCAGDRFVGQFVPFYFCPRSPMLFVVNNGRTGHPVGCQRTILHLVTSVEKAISTGRDWAYSDGNAGAAYPSFYQDVSELDERLNWDAINENRNWSAVSTAKQAEFLVADTYPWTSIIAIGCYDAAAAEKVTAALAGAAYRPNILVRRNWYY